MFYQDDEFYNRLIRIVSNTSDRSKHLWARSISEATPPTSPCLRLRKFASVTGSSPSIAMSSDPQSPLLRRKFAPSSPLVIRKRSNTTNSHDQLQFSPSSQHYFTPPGSPTVGARKTSQNETPASPSTRMRRMTPCPPPTENMLGSPRLKPKLHISTSLPSSPVTIRHKTSQTSPLAKPSTPQSGSPLSSPCYSPLSSSPDSPIMRRKVSQTSPSSKYAVTSPLAENHDHLTAINRLQEDAKSHSESMTTKTSLKEVSTINVKMPSSPSLHRVVRQRSYTLDSLTQPSSPKPEHRRKISVKFNLAGEDIK